MARKYNMDGSYTIRNRDGATKVFPDGKRFYMNAAGQKALQEYYKSGGFARVQTGTQETRERYYGGAPKAGGTGLGYKTKSTPTFGYIRTQPFAAPKSDPKPVAKTPKVKAVKTPETTATEKATKKILDTADEILKGIDIAAKAAADQRKIDMQIDAARSANAARAGRAASLQIQPAEQVPTTAGTQAFKRRKNQFNVSGAYGGLSKISSGMVNL